MKVNSLPQPADFPVVSIELTRDEALQLAGMLMSAISFARAPLAQAIHESLVKLVGEDRAVYSYDADIELFTPVEIE